MPEDQNRTLTDKFMLRFPDGLRDRVKAAAAENNRSMNSEIIATLEDKYPAPKPDLDAELETLKAAFDLLKATPEDQRTEVWEAQVNSLTARFKDVTLRLRLELGIGLDPED